uniref:CACTA en-spm transposon protein n=1 Tax=Cucumis melo TaxID=3656 RepID=A0A9I9EGI1_CUCME
MSTDIMSYARNNFLETDAMFLEFEDNLDNDLAGGSSSVGKNAGEVVFSTPATPIPRRRAQSRLLKLERHVAVNERIPMKIVLGAEKPISPHAVRFNQVIGVCVQKTFSVCYLKWADVGREYIEVVKGNVQRFFVLDFNNQEMNRFVEHHMLTTFKEVQADCYRHFKKYSDPEETRANPPNEQSRTNKVVRQKQPYNHSSGSKSFLQQQHKLAEKKGERSIVWSCLEKHTFESGRSCREPYKMHINMFVNIPSFIEFCDA